MQTSDIYTTDLQKYNFLSWKVYEQLSIQWGYFFGRPTLIAAMFLVKKQQHGNKFHQFMPIMNHITNCSHTSFGTNMRCTVKINRGLYNWHSKLNRSQIYYHFWQSKKIIWNIFFCIRWGKWKANIHGIFWVII